MYLAKRSDEHDQLLERAALGSCAMLVDNARHRLPEIEENLGAVSYTHLTLPTTPYV